MLITCIRFQLLYEPNDDAMLSHGLDGGKLRSPVSTRVKASYLNFTILVSINYITHSLVSVTWHPLIFFIYDNY